MFKTYSGQQQEWQRQSPLSEAGGGQGCAAKVAQREGGEGDLARRFEGETVRPLHGGLGRRRASVHCVAAVSAAYAASAIPAAHRL